MPQNEKSNLDKKIEDLIPKKNKIEEYVHVISAIPYIGSPISGWISEKRNNKYWERCIAVLEKVSKEIKLLKEKEVELFLDENFAELTVKLFPQISNTIQENKRNRYAYLLANASIRKEKAQREEAETMADILDQLEFKHVSFLDFIAHQPSHSNATSLWGVRQHVTLKRKELDRGHGKLLHRMKYVGLLDFNVEKEPEYKVNIEINSFGQDFHEWVTKPMQNDKPTH